MKAQTDAAIAALTAAWPKGQVHKVGAVPTSPATPYVVVSVSGGNPVNYRRGSVHTSRAYRLAVQYVGKDYDEAAFVVEKGTAAFLDKRLDPSWTPCRLELEPSINRDPDGGVLMYALATFTFTA